MSVVASLAPTPVAHYTQRAVAETLGLPLLTLRNWERHHTVLTAPHTDDGERRYSDYDLRALQWLKAQVDAGATIRQAARQLAQLREAGLDPALAAEAASRPASIPNLAHEALSAFIHLDEARALQAFRLAFSIYPLDVVLTEIVQPTLVEIGERWRRGEAPIAIEHFATQFCLRYLMSWLALAEPPSHPGRIVAACAPGERHEIGLLMLVVMLRWRGWEVQYLGPDLSLDRLDEILLPRPPRLLLLTATRPESADTLSGLPKLLRRLPAPRPKLVFGGQAFSAQRAKALAGIYLHGRPSEIVQTIEDLMEKKS